MKQLLLVLPFVCIITACGGSSVDDLVDDPELLRKTLQECIVNAAQGKENDSKKCENAVEAQKKLQKSIYNNVIKQLTE